MLTILTSRTSPPRKVIMLFINNGLYPNGNRFDDVTENRDIITSRNVFVIVIFIVAVAFYCAVELFLWYRVLLVLIDFDVYQSKDRSFYDKTPTGDCTDAN